MNSRHEASVLYCLTWLTTLKHFDGCFNYVKPIASLSSHSFWVIKSEFQGWEDGSTFKRIYCSSRGPNFDPLLPIHGDTDICNSASRARDIPGFGGHLRSCPHTNRHTHNQNSNKSFFLKGRFWTQTLWQCRAYTVYSLVKESDTGWCVSSDSFTALVSPWGRNTMHFPYYIPPPLPTPMLAQVRIVHFMNERISTIFS